MNKLKNALISIESRFLLSIQDGPKEWGALSSNWSLLRDQLEQGARNKTLDTELISLARAVSGRIGIIAEGQLALYAASQKLTTKFVQDIDDTFAHTASIIDTPEAAYETLSAPRNTEGAKDLGGMARPGTETYIPPSSPHPSHPSTPTSTPLADVDDDDTPAPRVAGVKRRASVQEENSDLCSPRSLKRSRYGTISSSSQDGLLRLDILVSRPRRIHHSLTPRARRHRSVQTHHFYQHPRQFKLLVARPLSLPLSHQVASAAYQTQIQHLFPNDFEAWTAFIAHLLRSTVWILT